MGWIEVVIIYKEVPFIMMPLLVWFGLKIKSLQELIRLWWESHGLRNGYGIRLQPKFPITTEKKSYLLSYSIDTITSKRGRLRVFLELVPSTRTHNLNMPFKMLCIWILRSLCMLHCICLREVMMISLCSLSPLRIRFGFITDFLAINQASLLLNYWPRPGQIIANFYDATFGVALSLF